MNKIGYEEWLRFKQQEKTMKCSKNKYKVLVATSQSLRSSEPTTQEIIIEADDFDISGADLEFWIGEKDEPEAELVACVKEASWIYFCKVE